MKILPQRLKYTQLIHAKELCSCSLFLQHNLGTKPSLCNEFWVACGVGWKSLIEIQQKARAVIDCLSSGSVRLTRSKLAVPKSNFSSLISNSGTEEFIISMTAAVIFRCHVILNFLVRHGSFWIVWKKVEDFRKTPYSWFLDKAVVLRQSIVFAIVFFIQVLSYAEIFPYSLSTFQKESS